MTLKELILKRQINPGAWEHYPFITMKLHFDVWADFSDYAKECIREEARLLLAEHEKGTRLVNALAQVEYARRIVAL